MNQNKWELSMTEIEYRKFFDESVLGMHSTVVRNKLNDAKKVKFKIKNTTGFIDLVSENDKTYMVLVIDGKIVIKRPYVEWSKVDEDYNLIIYEFADRGIDDDWLNRVTKAYRSRFKKENFA